MFTTENMNLMLTQAKRINENLQQTVPGYKNLNDVAFAIYGYSAQKA